jgi:glutamate formiminotransferase/formiminotetrahydrofolate cyclodeaminase
MLGAGRHYLRKQSRSTGVSDAELIKIAVKSMGLDELYPFKPEEKIIEYVLAAADKRKCLVDLTIAGFCEETASESPAPGGGSVAATLGSLGAALSTMVANLSSHKQGWDARWEEFSDWAEKGKSCMVELLALVDKDTDAFNAIMASWRLPSGSEAEKAAKQEAIQVAVLQAIAVPFRIMEVSLASMEVAGAMAEHGLSASASDAGVAALCARAAVRGAYLNVRINASDLEDEAARQDFLDRGADLVANSEAQETKILAKVESHF